VIWTLRLLRGDIASARTDWDRVAGPSPGHDFRHALHLARSIVDAAAGAVHAGEMPAPDWDARARSEVRAARRVLARREMEFFGTRVATDRRYYA
jgi:hypothetical protein